MPDKIFGDLEVYGVVTVGSKTDGSSGAYTLPYKKGENGSILGIAPAPSSTGLSGTMPQWVSPTAAPFNLVTSDMVSALVDVGITGTGGVEVVKVAQNQFIVSLYVPLTASMSISPNSFEVGQSITGCTLNWSYNKSVVSQSINQGIGSRPIADRTYVYTTPISSNITFTLTGNDGTQNATANASISFNRRRYWGTIPSSQNTLPTNAQLLSGSSELSSSRAKSITYNCSVPSGGNYFYYAYPTSLGIGSVTVNGFPFSDWFDPSNPPAAITTPATVSVTGQYGTVVNYYVYRVYNVMNGASIPVVFG